MLKTIEIGRKLFSNKRRLSKISTLPINQEGIIYHCSLTSEKKKNLLKQTISDHLLPFYEISRPHILHVGVTTRCNLRCPACPTGTKTLGRKNEDLSLEVFCKTVDELQDSLLFMLFWDWGEPLLHPDLHKMLQYANQYCIKTVISTNGNVSYSDQQLLQLLSAKPSTIIVCVDGADQATYESYRAGGNLQKVLEFMRKIKQLKQNLNQLEPVIEFRSLATVGTENQMPDLVSLAQENGADLFSVKTLRPYNYRGENVDEFLVPKKETLSRYRYRGKNKRSSNRKEFVSKGRLTCAKPLYAPTLNADGNLTFCSYAIHQNEIFGNLSHSTFSKIWKSSQVRNNKKQFLRNEGSLACKTCYFRSAPAPTIIHQVPLDFLPDYIEIEKPCSIKSFLVKFN